MLNGSKQIQRAIEQTRLRCLFSAVKGAGGEAGFSLLEMAVVLAILGILSSFAIPLLSQQREKTALQITKQHQQRVIESLESYLLHHEHLPFPTTPAENGAGNQNTSLRVGIVPYRTLGIPESWVKDGYGNYMTYAVANDACTGPIRDNSFCQRLGQESPKVLDQTNENVLIMTENNDDYIVFVLISHGPDGNNNFRSQHSLATHPSPAEEENNNGDLNFRIHPYSTNPTNLFRHRVEWRTKQAFAGFCKAENLKKKLSELHTLTQTLNSVSDLLESFQNSTTLASETFSQPMPSHSQDNYEGTTQ